MRHLLTDLCIKHHKFFLHPVERMSRVLEKNGDFDCLINGYYNLYGKTKSCGRKSQTLSQLIEDSRKLGACFYNKVGLRKGDYVHILLPNCTDYHSIAIGAWMCEAIGTSNI